MITATEQKETNAEYHADLTHYSHSMLEVYHKSPARFAALYVSKTMEQAPPTLAMVLGSMVHTLVMEPDTFGAIYTVAEGCQNRMTKAWKSMVAMAEADGRECVLPTQVDVAEAMAKAVLAHPVAAKLLAMEGITEEPIRWKDSNDGLPLKCKPDYLITDKSLDCMLCVDLKTSIAPAAEEFAKQAYNYGYHRQAAHYNEGCTAKHDRPCRPVYIVVGKEEPHDVFVYQPDDEYVELGHYENTVTLAALENSLSKNEWLAENQNELQTLSLPAWARRKTE